MMDMEINANVLELAVHRTSPHSLSPLGQATCAERSRRKKPGDIIYISKHCCSKLVVSQTTTFTSRTNVWKNWRLQMNLEPLTSRYLEN